jgi:hypothetical protein
MAIEALITQGRLFLRGFDQLALDDSHDSGRILVDATLGKLLTDFIKGGLNIRMFSQRGLRI